MSTGRSSHSGIDDGLGWCAGLLICPVCGRRLAAVDRSLKCAERHTFDRAREGYVDLLPAGHGRSGKTGDTREMLESRRRFLERGHYEPLVGSVVEHTVRHAAGRDAEGRDADGGGSRFTVVEVGSGEGHFIGRVADALEGAEASREACVFGVDISKDAVKLAARRDARIGYFVNDVTHRLCLADGCVDVVLDVFAPRNVGEFERITRRDGLVVVAIPTERHLRELRSMLPLLEIEPEKEVRTVERFAPVFSLAGRDEIDGRATLAGDDVLDLLRMTPNYWHLDEEAFERAAALGGVEVTLGFRVLSFRKTGDGVVWRGGVG